MPWLHVIKQAVKLKRTLHEKAPVVLTTREIACRAAN